MNTLSKILWVLVSMGIGYTILFTLAFWVLCDIRDLLTTLLKEDK